MQIILKIEENFVKKKKKISKELKLRIITPPLLLNIKMKWHKCYFRKQISLKKKMSIFYIYVYIWGGGMFWMLFHVTVFPLMSYLKLKSALIVLLFYRSDFFHSCTFFDTQLFSFHFSLYFCVGKYFFWFYIQSVIIECSCF